MINFLKNCLKYTSSFGNLLSSLKQLKDLFRKSSKHFVIIIGSYKRIDTLTGGSKRYIYVGEKYNFIYLRKLTIFSTFFLLFFKYLSKLRKYKVIKIISDEKEKYKKWDFSLEWNNHQGAKGKRSKAIFLTDDVSVSKENQPLKLFLPIISKTNNLRTNFENIHPIYIGIIGYMKSLEISNEEANEDSLIYDQTDFSINKNINEFAKRRCRSRLYFVKELKKYYGDWFELLGIGWEKYNIEAKSIGYNKKIINQRYIRAGICLDFLSQFSNNCLYERSINILNSGGILIQRKSYNSELVFGDNFVDKFCFSTLSELIYKINKISSLGYEAVQKDIAVGITNAKKYQSKYNQKCLKRCFEIVRDEN